MHKAVPTKRPHYKLQHSHSPNAQRKAGTNGTFCRTERKKQIRCGMGASKYYWLGVRARIICSNLASQARPIATDEVHGRGACMRPALGTTRRYTTRGNQQQIRLELATYATNLPIYLRLSLTVQVTHPPSCGRRQTSKLPCWAPLFPPVARCTARCFNCNTVPRCPVPCGEKKTTPDKKKAHRVKLVGNTPADLHDCSLPACLPACSTIHLQEGLARRKPVLTSHPVLFSPRGPRSHCPSFTAASTHFFLPFFTLVSSRTEQKLQNDVVKNLNRRGNFCTRGQSMTSKHVVCVRGLYIKSN